MVKSKAANRLGINLLKPGKTSFHYYKSSKQNELNQFIQSTIQENKYHIIMCKGKVKDPTMKFSPGDIVLMPSGELSYELVKNEMDDDSNDE